MEYQHEIVRLCLGQGGMDITSKTSPRMHLLTSRAIARVGRHGFEAKTDHDVSNDDSLRMDAGCTYWMAKAFEWELHMEPAVRMRGPHSNLRTTTQN